MKTRSYLIFMAAAILIPVLVFSGLGLYLLLKQERESRLRAVEETARATALAIDQEIADAEGALRVLAHTQYIQADDFVSLHKLMQAGNKTPDAWTVVFDYDGKVLVNSLVPIDKQFFTVRYPWIAGVFDSQKPYVSDLRNGLVSNDLVISVSVPIPSSVGKKYVLNQTYRADHFNRSLALRPIPKTWIVGLFDSKGISIGRNKDAANLTGKPVRPDLYQASLGAFSGRTRHVTRENIAVYSVFTHTERTGWTVAIGVPESEIELAARQAVAYTAAALGLVFALASLGVLILVRRLTRAVTIAESAARTLGQGRIPAVQPSNVSELDMLQLALHDAGTALSRENAARRQLEQERESLLGSERQARQLAEEQNKAKDEFLAMLGHELRNPLGAISSALMVMTLPGAKPEQVKRAHDIAHRQAEHLAKIMDDLLDVGRVMAGKILLKKQTIELGEFVKRSVDSHAVHHATHRWHVDVHEVWVDADPTRLEQIIGNILANAVRYTPAGGSIDVRVRSQGDEAVVEITDTGIGMSDELLPRIFDVFVQGPATIDRAQGGLGLGLALVKRLLTLHGGTVTAQSPGPGQGSSFMMRLPRHDRKPSGAGSDNGAANAGHDARSGLGVTAGAGASTSAGAHGEAGGLASAQSVLVVEDNDEGREMLVAVLALHGFRVSSASTGSEALQRSQVERPGVAIIDIGLPDMTGYDLARRLGGNETTRHTKLIALTGYGQLDDRERAMQAGFAFHLTKPYAIEKLLELVTVNNSAEENR
jgi:signal transduction histidine kinase/ActR/RegA family two-component response regulator